MNLYRNLIVEMLRAARDHEDEGREGHLIYSKIITGYPPEVIEGHRGWMLDEGLLESSSVAESEHGDSLPIRGITPRGREYLERFQY